MTSQHPETNPNRESRPGRRALLGGGLASVAAVGVGAAGALALHDEPAPEKKERLLPGQVVHRFHGDRQAGVAEPPQPWSTLVAFDLATGANRERMRRLMRIWTEDISRLTSGVGPLTDQEPELAQRASGLTVTVGWGPRVFDVADLADARPSWAKPLPSFAHDKLDPNFSGGDVVLQIGAHSPMTVAHAQRQLTTAAHELAKVRWVQPGFREPMEYHGWSMRNLFGQVDGTVQPRYDGEDSDLVWIGSDGPSGWVHGSSMVVRRVAMDLDSWDKVGRAGRESAVGRRLADGAPLTGRTIKDPVDLTATLDNGLPVIDTAAHVRRASAVTRQEQFLRRPYMYQDVVSGKVLTGLVFISFQADPVRQFVPVQQRLAEADLMNLWTTPVGSAVFAILPGCRPGRYLGQEILA